MGDKKLDEKPPPFEDQPVANGMRNGSDGESRADSVNPPAYNEQQPPPPGSIPEDLSRRLNELNLSATEEGLPTPDRCIAHLKFLEALHQLRDNVASTDGLFGIATPPEKKSEKPSEKKENSDAQIAVREKRWAVYVARAVERFEAWWTKCVPATIAGAPAERLNADGYLNLTSEHIAMTGQPIAQLSRENLPPLGRSMAYPNRCTPC